MEAKASRRRRKIEAVQEKKSGGRERGGRDVGEKKRKRKMRRRTERESVGDKRQI